MLLIHVKQPKHSFESILPYLSIAFELQDILQTLHTLHVPLRFILNIETIDKNDIKAPKGHINLQKNLYVNILINNNKTG